jgi:cyanophycinase
MRLYPVILSVVLVVLFVSTLTAGDHGGTLFIIGGGSRPDYLMKEFIHLAGGDTARIVVIPMASGSPGETAAYQMQEFERLGAGSVATVYFDSSTADTPENIATVEQATGIFFSGGDQNRLMAALNKTRLLNEIIKRYDGGGIIGGTSAGAAVMSEIMITGDEYLPERDSEPFATIRRDNIITNRGIGFIRCAIIDQHFIERKRHNRLISLVLEHPDRLGIGIGESTAIRVDHDGSGTILGEGLVIIYDARHARDISQDQNGNLSARDLKMHILKSGDQYNLIND